MGGVRSASKDEDELIDDLDALAGLEAIGPVEPVKRSYGPHLSLSAAGDEAAPRQERDGAGVRWPARSRSASTDMDRRLRQITVKAGPGKAHLLGDRLTLHPDWPLDPKSSPVPCVT